MPAISRRIDQVAQHFIEDRAPVMTPTEILRAMQGDQFLVEAGLPSLRTIESIVAASRRPDARVTEHWRYEDSPPEDAALVLETVGQSQQRDLAVSVAQARWIVFLRRGWPDMPPREAFNVARSAAANPEALARLRSYLAFTPWRDGGERYLAAYRRRRFRGLFLTDATQPAFERWVKEKTGGQPEGQPPAK